MTIRAERADDAGEVREVNRAAFGTDAEANLVDALRGRMGSVISLVADDAGRVIGHILFSPVALSGSPMLKVAALGPMAVLPAHQRGGVGSALVRAGLDACRARGYQAVVVVGHAEFYPRFGFRPASAFGLACEFDVPDDAWMALELERGALRDRAGTIRYHPSFRSV